MTDKACKEDLAIFGAPPAFAAPLHVGRPNLPDRDRLHCRIADLLERRWLTNDGPYVRELEERVARQVEAPHAVAVANATLGLALAARALGLQGEVILPALTFVGTAHAFHWVGLRPVFADVDARTHTLDPAAAEQAVTPQTSAIVGVHLWGRSCNVPALEDLARRRRLALLFDAAHAFGCHRQGVPIGGFGEVEVFSLHATKIVNAFEGGLVVTRDSGLARRIARLRNFGFDGYDRVAGPGVNGKMSEPAAAMALGCLEDLERFKTAGARHHALYRDRLGGLPGVTLIAPPPGDAWNHHYTVAEIDAVQAGLNRDELLEVLWAENVHARRYFYPGCHRAEPYRSEAASGGAGLTVTERILDGILQLPAGAAAVPHEIERTASILRIALAHAAEIRARLRTREAAGTRAYGRVDVR